MRHVGPPTVNDETLFDAITSAKRVPQRARLLAIRNVILAAYAGYAAAAPEVGHLPAAAINVDQREALLHAYAVETKPLKRLRDLLNASVVLARCPFCGLGETSTLDHYLPKELHPQFSVYSRNLVPCCSPCNTRKNLFVLDDATDIRLFIHPYFDPIPDQQFVTVAVLLLPTSLGLKFQIEQTPGLEAALFQQLESHFRLLGLGDRYRKMSLEHLRSERRALERFHAAGGGARVATELANDASDWEDEFGLNHWRAVLYRALAAHADFCNGGFAVLNAIQ